MDPWNHDLLNTDSFLNSLDCSSQFPAPASAPIVPEFSSTLQEYACSLNCTEELILTVTRFLRNAIETTIKEEMGNLFRALQSIRSLVHAEIQQMENLTRTTETAIRETRGTVEFELTKMKDGMENFMQALGGQFGLTPREVN